MDEEVTIHVSFGREKLQVCVARTCTWGDVAARVVSQSSSGVTNVRLMHRGRTANPSETLTGAEVKDGARVIAMKTQLQHVTERKEAARTAAREGAAAADRLAETQSQEAPRPASSGSSGLNKAQVLGDAVNESDEDAYYVVVSHAGRLYRVALEGGEATIADLMSGIERVCGAKRQHQRLLFAGKRNFDKAATLTSVGAKRKSKFMLLLSADAHDEKEAHVDLATLAKQVDTLATSVRGLKRKVDGRLLSDYAELTIGVSEVGGECERLTGNVEAIRARGGSEDERTQKELLDKLENVSTTIDELREQANARLR